ncbi:unnamed protein product [Triticum turgidum subsp. durum]|uniref:Diacylglycerol O-acyltransferase n=1 Tax=Triticum turgidum subsp. durum TaxID=4567 RepID=A0A9R0XEE8_TRITD|nr:unnamed protein product [Triticum turgidum subsp. durum]
MDDSTTNGSPSVAGLPTSPLLPIRTPRKAPADDPTADGEPVTPTARLMEPIYIVVTLGLGCPVNIPVFSAGIAAQLARYPRFCSIQVTDESNGGNPRWVRTVVNVDDHTIIPTLDPAAVAADPDRAVEDYMASLPALPMDRSRPLWEFHFLDFPTSEATCTAVIRVHHSLGDGTTLIALLLASARSAADPTRLPAMPEQPARTGAIYAPRPRSKGGVLAFVAWAWSYLVLAWNTVVDVTLFAATVAFLSDPHTPFKYVDHGTASSSRRRFVHRSLPLEDVKFIKNAMNCTVNDVLVGATSAALSRYYFRKSGANNTKICLRSILLVDTRPTTSLQTYVDMIDSGKSDDVDWGNQLGYILLPFHLAMHDDPLAYVRKAKKTVDRKKSSLEVIFTCKMGESFLKMFGLKGLLVQCQSYNSTIMVSLSVDEEIIPDYIELMDDFVESFGRIKDGASRLSTSIKQE